jgi:hypothetical protein
MHKHDLTKVITDQTTNTINTLMPLPETRLDCRMSGEWKGLGRTDENHKKPQSG